MDKEILNLMSQINGACQSVLGQSAALKASGLAVFPARLLSVISRSPGWSQQELASAVGRDKAQVARTIRELEMRGLVIRTPHGKDWRSLCLRLTESGQEIADLLNNERIALAEQMMSGLAAEEKPALKGLLQRMLATLLAGNGPAQDDVSGTVVERKSL